MTFPVVETTNTGVAESAFGTSHTANLPASIAAGDYLILVIAWTADPGTITATGWTFLTADANLSRIQFAYRAADGSEGATLSITTTNSIKLSATAYRISGADTATAPEKTTASTGNSTNADPPNNSPSWGALDTLWIAACITRGASITVAPTNYSNLLTNASTGTAATIVGSAQRQLNAASENPGAFTSASGTWVAQTLAIKPRSIVVLGGNFDFPAFIGKIRMIGYTVAAWIGSGLFNIRLKQRPLLGRSLLFRNLPVGFNRYRSQ